MGREYGHEEFDRRLASAREIASQLPGFDEWTQLNNGVLSYRKGPVLLHDLHERIGPDAFDRFIQTLQANSVGTIEEMLETLAEVTGEEHARWLKAAME